jgi:hypothetical protein
MDKPSLWRDKPVWKLGSSLVPFPIFLAPLEFNYGAATIPWDDFQGPKGS